MGEFLVSQVLTRLREAADHVYHAWPTMQWSKVAGSGPTSVEQRGRNPFTGLTFEPGSNLTLRSRVHIPDQLAGISLAGEALELTIFSIYALDLRWNGTRIFAEQGVPVASGPALVQVMPALQGGDNGELLAHIHIPSHQTTPWFHLYFTTPLLRERFELLDVAWSQLSMADALATTAEEHTIVAQAAAQVPETPLALNQRTLHAAVQRLEEMLAPLATKIQQHTVHVIGHSHIDMNWLWTWPDTVEVIKRDFSSVLSIMDDYPELHFTHSQPATYEVIRQQEPELFARVLEHIKSGRWEPATMAWLEGDVNMASGESLARQLLEGVTYSREVLGKTPTTFLAPDTFGHPGNLPQLALSAGAQRYYHHRCNPSPADIWPAYWWQGQDGSRLLTVSTPTYNGDIHARSLAETAIHAYKHGLPVSLHFHGIGDHGGGPARHNLDALRRFQQRPLLPVAHCSTLEAYTNAVLACGVTLPVHEGELNSIFEGCYTTHADTKYSNRQGENLLTSAEALTALANQNHTDPLQDAWRKVLFNQFHDIFDGSAIHETYEKNATDFAEVVAAATEVTTQALTVLEAGLPMGRIAVTNPLSWQREDWVVVPGRTGEGAVWLVGDHGHKTAGQWTADGLGFIASTPAFSTVGYQVQTDLTEPMPEALQAITCGAPMSGKDADALTAEDFVYFKIETKGFRVYLRKDNGILVSFFDKRVGRELVSYGFRKGSGYLDTARVDLALNVLQLLEEHPHGMSAWQMDEVHVEQSLLRGATSQVIESGPVRLVVEVRHRLRTSSIVQQIIFYRDLARIDFHTDIDWQEIGNSEVGVPNLKIAFTARMLEAEAWFETPFAAIQRPADGQEVPALRWADVGGSHYGIALLNDSKYGYDALGTRLRLSLVRSAYEPDAISDVGQHKIRYSLLPHPGNWREAGVVQAASAFNQPLLVREVTSDAQTVAALATWRPELSGGASVLIAGLKVAHDHSGHVLHLYESAGHSTTVQVSGLPAHARVWETSLVEDRLHELTVQGGHVKLSFTPWRVRVLLVEE